MEAYAKAQGYVARQARRTGPGVHRHTRARSGKSVVPSLAGPKRPQDRVAMTDLGKARSTRRWNCRGGLTTADRRVPVPGTDYDLGHGDVVIAAITSCTNTSNPAVMLGAGIWWRARSPGRAGIRGP